MNYRYPSRRSVVYAKNGMASSTQPIVSSTGVEILKKGGNAIDAAIAMAALMPVAEPMSNSIGGDAFALIWKDGRLYGLNASGFAPKGLDGHDLLAKGYDKVPMDGWIPTMVPGCVDGWVKTLDRFGNLDLKTVMDPAIRYAHDGFALTETGSELMERAIPRFKRAEEKAPGLFEPWFKLFTKDGKAYGQGEVFRSKEMAATLEEIAETRGESFYRGRLRDLIVAHSDATGGYFTKEDFSSYSSEWVDPISVEYKGCDVWELPPNGHGITVLMALNILKNLEAKGEREDSDTYHKTIEALKLAFTDTKKYVADPRYMKTRVEELLSPAYAKERAALIGHDALTPKPGKPFCGGTVYFSTADREGNMVSFIQSHYCSFGSGVVVPGTGICLQDRGANFSLDPSSDNFLEGGKKSYHTIIPGFLTKDGKAVGAFGVMGGFMQPQGHVQVLRNLLEYGMNVQEALDAPRVQWLGDKDIQVEASAGRAVIEDLIARGHNVEVVSDYTDMGRGQIILRREDGVLVGGTEPRSDGSIVSY